MDFTEHTYAMSKGEVGTGNSANGIYYSHHWSVALESPFAICFCPQSTPENYTTCTMSTFGLKMLSIINISARVREVNVRPLHSCRTLTAGSLSLSISG